MSSIEKGTSAVTGEIMLAISEYNFCEYHFSVIEGKRYASRVNPKVINAITGKIIHFFEENFRILFSVFSAFKV